MIYTLALDPLAAGPATISRDGLEVTVERFLPRLIARAAERPCNLVVLCNLAGEDASRAAARLRRVRRLRNIPILYVMPPGSPGIIVPSSFRPGRDGIVVGRLESSPVIQAIRRRALDAVDPSPPPPFGPYHLDRRAGLLHFGEREISLPAREAEVLGVLFEAGAEFISIDAIASNLEPLESGRSPSRDTTRRYLSRLRERLRNVRGAPRIVARQGLGYRLEVSPEWSQPE